MSKRTPIKVKAILENYFFLGRVKIIYSEDDGSEETYYDGTALDCPYWIADLYIDTDINGEGLGVEIDKDKDGKPEALLTIYIREDKDY